jgi:simple sugar transport system ATP-binding protein
MTAHIDMQASQASTEPLLRLEGIDKHYGAVQALQKVSLDVFPGEIVGLVGDNGSGKSTTIKIVSGLIQPNSGRLYFDGQQRRWESPRDAKNVGIETLYQEMGIVPHVCVSGNIFLGREIRRRGILGRLGFMDERAMRARTAEMLSDLRVDIPDGTYPAEALSGGQRQAVAIGKSLSWARRLLILDEPTNHLGVGGTTQLLRLLREVKRNGVACIFVSHTIPHVLDVCDRIVVLWRGRAVANMNVQTTTIDSVVRAITSGEGGATP